MNSNFCVAVHGLIYLYFCQSTVSSEELAKHVCTNPARVRKVMLMLKKQGLVQTREGKDGGYRCGRDHPGSDRRGHGNAFRRRISDRKGMRRKRRRRRPGTAGGSGPGLPERFRDGAGHAGAV